MNKKSSIALTFILILGISLLLGAFIFLVFGRTTDSGLRQNREKAFYTAEAGINKAIWYLNTPTGLGGKGSSWRVANFSEAFKEGSYRFSILEETSGILSVISTGEMSGVTRTIIQKMHGNSLPAAFSYAIYNNGSLTLKGASSIMGDLFANGDISIQKASNHPSGDVFTTAGHTVNGTPGEVPDPIPTMPALNTTTYDQKILAAQSQPAGNRILNNTNLGGGITYINGDATISGTITGGGTIVVTGKATISSATISKDTTIISNGLMTIQGNSNMDSGAILYSPTQISIPGTPRIYGSVMSAKITANGNPTILGLLFSWDVSTELTGNVTVYGSVVNPSSSSYTGSINIEFRPEYLPAPPEGLSSGGLSLVKGSWKEL